MGQGFSLKTVGSPVQLIRELKRGVLLEYYINLWELKLDIMIQIRSRGFQQNKKNVMSGAGAAWSRPYCLELEPTSFGRSRSRLRDLGRPKPKPPKKVRLHNNFSSNI